MNLELFILDPTPSQQQLTFSCVNEFEGFRIRSTLRAAVDTSANDASADDVTTPAPVDYIDFAATDGFGPRADPMTIESDGEIASSPNVDAAVKERCEMMAKHLFGTCLTITAFAQGEQLRALPPLC